MNEPEYDPPTPDQTLQQWIGIGTNVRVHQAVRAAALLVAVAAVGFAGSTLWSVAAG